MISTCTWLAQGMHVHMTVQCYNTVSSLQYAVWRHGSLQYCLCNSCSESPTSNSPASSLHDCACHSPFQPHAWQQPCTHAISPPTSPHSTTIVADSIPTYLLIIVAMVPGLNFVTIAALMVCVRCNQCRSCCACFTKAMRIEHTNSTLHNHAMPIQVSGVLYEKVNCYHR